MYSNATTFFCLPCPLSSAAGSFCWERYDILHRVIFLVYNIFKFFPFTVKLCSISHCIARQQHPYIIARFVNARICCNMLSKHDCIVRLASIFRIPSTIHQRCIRLLPKATNQLFCLYRLRYQWPPSSLPWAFLALHLLSFSPLCFPSLSRPQSPMLY